MKSMYQTLKNLGYSALVAGTLFAGSVFGQNQIVVQSNPSHKNLYSVITAKNLSTNATQKVATDSTTGIATLNPGTHAVTIDALNHFEKQDTITVGSTSALEELVENDSTVTTATYPNLMDYMRLITATRGAPFESTILTRFNKKNIPVFNINMPLWVKTQYDSVITDFNASRNVQFYNDNANSNNNIEIRWQADIRGGGRGYTETFYDSLGNVNKAIIYIDTTWADGVHTGTITRELDRALFLQTYSANPVDPLYYVSATASFNTPITKAVIDRMYGFTNQREDMSKHKNVVVTYINHLPSSFTINKPVDGDSVKHDNVQVPISWSKSYDVNILTYLIHLTGGTLDTTFSTRDTSLSFSSKILKSNTKYTLDGRVTNGVDTVSATNAPCFYTSTLTGVDKIANSIPKDFELYQNYPNPFNPETNIEYTVPCNSDVLLKVYDLLGREVTTLVDKRQNAGTYKTNFDARNKASGIYFYRIEEKPTNGKPIYVQTKKMVFTK